MSRQPVRCHYAGCTNRFTPKRSAQLFCTPRHRSLQLATDGVADVLRECVASGLLPRTMERRASAALRAAMPAVARTALTRRQP
jgi:hypothetical protein